MPSIVNLMHLFMFNVKRNERAKVFHKHTYFEKGFSLHTLMGIMGSVGGSLAIRQTNWLTDWLAELSDPLSQVCLMAVWVHEWFFCYFLIKHFIFLFFENKNSYFW